MIIKISNNLTIRLASLYEISRETRTYPPTCKRCWRIIHDGYESINMEYFSLKEHHPSLVFNKHFLIKIFPKSNLRNYYCQSCSGILICDFVTNLNKFESEFNRRSLEDMFVLKNVVSKINKKVVKNGKRRKKKKNN